MYILISCSISMTVTFFTDCYFYIHQGSFSQMFRIPLVDGMTFPTEVTFREDRSHLRAHLDLLLLWWERMHSTCARLLTQDVSPHWHCCFASSCAFRTFLAAPSKGVQGSLLLPQYFGSVFISLRACCLCTWVSSSFARFTGSYLLKILSHTLSDTGSWVTFIGFRRLYFI